MKKRSLSVILSTVLGLVFILSGFVKAVDPVGFSYKIEEYLSMFGMYGMKEWSVPLAVMSCAMETFLGMIVLLRVWKRTAAMISVAVILVFTAITLNTLVNPLNTITECGCFGEAVHLSNGASFAKNLELLAVAAALAYSVFKEGGRSGFRLRQLTLASGAFALSLAIPLLSCLFMPPFYFLDYNVGDRITEDNRIELFDRNLEHVRTDMTGTVRPLYIIGLRREMTDREAAKITDLYKACLAGKVDIVAASPSDGISVGPYADIPLYYIDETALKSILRSETGVVAISDGRITGKWNLEHTFCRFRDRYGKESAGQLLYRYAALAVALAFLVFLCLGRYKHPSRALPSKSAVRMLCAISAIVAFPSCSDLAMTRQRAGDNWPELQKVLARYRDGDDVEKAEAAEFLLRNMPYHHYLYSEEMEKAKSGFKMLRSATYSSYGRISDSLASSLAMQAQAEVRWDVRTLDSAYVCNNIEWAFKVWREQPWGRNVDFEIFCDYVLPYRIADEVPSEWRQEYYEKYNPLLDEFRESGRYDAEDPVEALRFLMSKLPILYEPLYAPRVIAHFPHIGPEHVQYFTGSCREYSDFVIYICRALGIPCAYNSTFNMHRVNVGHQWASFWNRYGEEYIISNYPPVLVANRQDYTLATPKMKVYRETYSINQPLMEKARSSRSPVNLFFALPTYSDVTATYTNRLKKTLEIPSGALFHRVPRNEPVYLCSSSRMQWCPEDYATLSGGRLAYHDVQTDEVYCLCVKSGNSMVPVSDPFHIGPESHSLHFFRNSGEKETVAMKSKFSVSYEEKMFRDRMINGVFEGSDSESFENRDTLYIVQGPPDRKLTRVGTYSATRRKYRFLRYVGSPGSHCDVADISFYDDDGSAVAHSRIMGTDGVDRTHSPGNAYDGDSKTSFSNGDADGGWCGIEIREPDVVHTVAYTPRNRDNFINAGDCYELFYYDRGWESLGRSIAESDILVYDDVPSGCLLLLKNHSGGVQERIFTFEGGQQIWR